VNGTAVQVVSAVLLWAGVVTLVVACLGVAVVRDAFDRLHFLALTATVGAPLIVVSLALQAGGWRSALKLLLIGAILFGTGPATTAVTARGRSRTGDGEGG
jgi:multicomponent Na+:H+ antiporter subunit G